MKAFRKRWRGLISRLSIAGQSERESACFAEHHFDIVLLDHDLGAERASLFLPAAREAGVEARVLVVTAWISENEARRLLRQGVSGIFLKQEPLDELKEAIRVTAGGGIFLDPSFSRLSGGPKGHSQNAMFSDRQRQVLRYMFEGFSNKEIAWRMQISESYVKAILQGLFQKTGVRTRGQLDVVMVHSGDGTLMLGGGTMSGKKGSAERGEYLGTALTGGEVHPEIPSEKAVIQPAEYDQPVLEGRRTRPA